MSTFLFDKLVPLLALLSSFCTALDLTYPKVLSSGSDEPSAWSLTLTVKIAPVVNDAVSLTSRLYCTDAGDCTYPGPTIKVHPGDNLTVTLVNELGSDDSPSVHNTMHAPNSTNLHTHGLHIDPATDTIFL